MALEYAGGTWGGDEMRPVYSLDLSPRENRHVEPSIGRDVWEIAMAGLLAFLLYGIVLLVML